MRRFQLFLRGVSTNWVGTLGVTLTTATFLLFVFFELLQVMGILSNAYVGLISYLALPALFVLGLILMPIGWWQFRRTTGKTTDDLLRERFPEEMVRPKRLGSSIVATIAVLTVVNILFLGIGGARMLHFMDTAEFCGTACHGVMEPEWTAYQNSPHAHVECVACHVGEGTGALIDAKLNGLWQIISVTFDLYERPIPTPVHQLRPARETCEKCHWPDKFYGDRIKSITRYALDEASTLRHTTLALKVGSGTGEETGTIHWHVATANEVRYQAANEQRTRMSWVEVKRGDSFHRYTNRRLEQAVTAAPQAGENADIRTMDCVDCHNRATHIYLDPEQAVDQALAAGRIDRSMPFAKKAALGALQGTFGDKDAALAAIDNSVRGFYLRDLGNGSLAASPAADEMIAELQAIYGNNVFPHMNVTWNTYASHLGHDNDGGCFRCHNPDMVDQAGRTIAYDCTLCHSILAMDSRREFQFLLPLDEQDPDREMHRYLQEEFLGEPLGEPLAAPLIEGETAPQTGSATAES